MNPRFVFLALLSLYSFIGIVWLKWNIFFFVYLFWFENIINIFADMVRVMSVSHFTENKGQVANKWQALGMLFGSIFVNFVYFIFIFIGLGILYPLFIKNPDLAKEFIFDMLKIVLFKNNSFNTALVACVVYNIIAYVRDFVLRPKYNAQNLYPFPQTFSKNDMILHITILIGLGSVFLLHHPEFGGKWGLDATVWADYGVGIVMIALRLGFGLYDAGKNFPTSIR